MRVAFVPMWASTTASQADYAMCVGLQCAARSPNARRERRRARPACGGERGRSYAVLDRAHFSGLHHCRTKNSASHICLSPSIVHDAQSDEMSRLSFTVRACPHIATEVVKLCNTVLFAHSVPGLTDFTVIDGRRGSA